MEVSGKLNINNGNVFTSRDKFRFMCHRNLQCFGKCCRDINIFLTPYDVLRIKDQLGIPSWEFLEKYTVLLTAGYTGFPVVILKMREEADLLCPFVTPQGCGVYNQRPWSCRMAPLDLRGEDRFSIAFDPEFCHGLKEDREWDAVSWMRDQGLENYDPVEKEFSRIPLELKLSGFKKKDRDMLEVFYNTCYNLDRFREFVSKKSFGLSFNVPREVIDKIINHQVELLKFGMEWLVSGIDFKKAQKMMARIKC
ncbi:hypothetical protein DCCM_1970 [Desulfocucumis palustris]|uniref:YkgJ family cysteine cluster protein n=1 Tax=Desulfocucumis palustris TaxID=1898651 RepID=A0A2L2XA91_9FIRM|nr:YkgJ family cysteine cluster protein [Desulfocucumis palustris]GBF32874.1 hypothetical protein DCCM_1970 [Desulfocucumis palustris]